MKHIENTVKRLCEAIDKQVEAEGLSDTVASVVQATAQIAQIAAGKKEPTGGSAGSEISAIEKQKVHSTSPSCLCNACLNVDVSETILKCKLDDLPRSGVCYCESYQSNS